MGIVLFSIALGMISLLLSFLFSVNVAGWFVWGICGIMSLFLFIKSFTEYKSLIKGKPKSVTDIMGMASFPFTASIMGIVLIIFLFCDVNKLHLLWIYSIVALIFDFTVGRRAGKRVRPDLFEKIGEQMEKE
ncbi:hypothetical protein KKC63_03155 [Patescibacteria group bacterium]|nr:hypothetical protein [Patescibacteria group bacterium]MBU4023464.1 hypothetical protein [Patescibacteria group bacterium]MBU4078179.1 hypothetical protein [Patescibacteria group bacterium]